MAIVASTLARIKADPLACLGGHERINDFFTQAGHTWRRCALDPAATLKLFILQVLNGNAAMAHLTSASSVEPRHLAGFDVCPSSFCDARTRLPVAADFGELSRAVAGFVDRVCGDCRKATDESSGSWLGHRVFIADATSASTPDEPVLQDLWPQPAAQKAG